MIDFRYHLVSLVAVFLALAVGIALGAGPLREGLSSTLEGEVGQLREERAGLRAQVDSANRRAAAKDEAVAVLAAGALPGTLEGVRAGVVLLPGADRNTVDELEDALEAAGAEIVVMAEVDGSAGGTDLPAERQQLLDELGATLQDPDPQDAGAPTVATVLAATLAGADAPGYVGAWLEAAAALEEEGLVDLTWRDGSTAEVSDRQAPDVLLVASGGLTEEAVEEPAGAESLGLRLELVESFGALDAPTVLAGAGAEVVQADGTDAVDPLVTAVREDDDLAATLSTVDNLESDTGQVAATMALAWELEGETGHYGVGQLAQAAVPVVPPLRLPQGGPSGTGLVPGTGGVSPTEPVPDDASATTAP